MVRPTWPVAPRIPTVRLTSSLPVARVTAKASSEYPAETPALTPIDRKTTHPGMEKPGL